MRPQVPAPGPPGALLRYLSSGMGGPGAGGLGGGLGAFLTFLREGTRWRVRSDNPYSKCGGAWRDKGPKLRFWLECW